MSGALNFGARATVNAAVYDPRFGLLLLVGMTPTIMTDGEESDTLEPVEVQVRVTPVAADEVDWLVDRLREQAGGSDSLICSN